jgi:hypothetical protein
MNETLIQKKYDPKIQQISSSDWVKSTKNFSSRTVYHHATKETPARSQGTHPKFMRRRSFLTSITIRETQAGLKSRVRQYSTPSLHQEYLLKDRSPQG